MRKTQSKGPPTGVIGQHARAVDTIHCRGERPDPMLFARCASGRMILFSTPTRILPVGLMTFRCTRPGRTSPHMVPRIEPHCPTFAHLPAMSSPAEFEGGRLVSDMVDSEESCGDLVAGVHQIDDVRLWLGRGVSNHIKDVTSFQDPVD